MKSRWPVVARSVESFQKPQVKAVSSIPPGHLLDPAPVTSLPLLGSPACPTPTPASWCLWDPSSMCLTWALPQVSCVHKGLTPGVLWAMLTLELGHHQVGWGLCVA